MASKKDKEDAFNEEFNRVDQELKKLQLELSDLHHNHDELMAKLSSKEAELAEKDEILIVVKERNRMELAQLEMEAVSVKERVQHEVNFHSAEVSNLKHRKLRLFELKTENARLHSTVKFLEESINRDRKQHALQLHDMNRNMKEHRQHMEIKLRKELNGLDISFQKDAFSALHDKQKRAMFQNAKLKDEVAIQGIGISNLNTRLAKQKVLYDNAKAELAKLHKKTDKLKQRVADHTTKRNHLVTLKEQIIKEIQDLKFARKAYIESIQQCETFLENSHPSMTDTSTSGSSIVTKKETREEVLTRLAFEYSELKYSFRQSVIELEKWKERESLLANVEPDLCPTNQQERNGIFEARSFPLFPLLQEIRKYREQLKCCDTLSGQGYGGAKLSNELYLATEDQFEFPEIIGEDEDLMVALEVIKGKENNISVACNKALHHHDSARGGGVIFDEPKDQNMIAWVTLRILSCWYKASCNAMNRVHNLSTIKSTSSKMISFESAQEEDHDEMEISDHEGNKMELSLEDALDAIWEQIEMEATPIRPNSAAENSTSSIHGANFSSNVWLKTTESPVPLMTLVANEMQVSLVSHGVPVPSNDIGPPVVMRSSIECKSPSKNTTEGQISGITLQEFFENELLQKDKSSGGMFGQVRSSTMSPHLSDLRANDPLIKNKRSKFMTTMKAHLENNNAREYQDMEKNGFGVNNSANRTKKSFSTSALRKGGKTLNINQSISEKSLNNKAPLSHSSYM